MQTLFFPAQYWYYWRFQSFGSISYQSLKFEFEQCIWSYFPWISTYLELCATSKQTCGAPYPCAVSIQLCIVPTTKFVKLLRDFIGDSFRCNFHAWICCSFTDWILGCALMKSHFATNAQKVFSSLCFSRLVHCAYESSHFGSVLTMPQKAVGFFPFPFSLSILQIILIQILN
jgi:hypothetical protein